MILTEHLWIRPFEAADVELIYRIYSDEEVLRYTPFDPMNMEQAEKHLCHVIEDWQQETILSYEFAVCLKTNGTGIGRAHILIDPETDTGMIGTLLIQDYWGNHFAT